MKHTFLLFYILFGTFSAFAQPMVDPDLDQDQLWIRKMQGDKSIIQLQVIDGDTIPMVTLRPISVVERKFENPADRYKFLKLRRNIIKVYPYAKRAANIMAEIEDATEPMNKKRHKKKYIKKLEKDLKTEFKDPLKNLTISQGKVLIKLLERESGKSCHELIKNYKNGVSAFFWQQLGRKWGYDLKEGYHPENYRDIELIINNLEATGELETTLK